MYFSLVGQTAKSLILLMMISYKKVGESQFIFDF